MIVSDALINDATFELLKHRPKTEPFFLASEFRKFEGVPAIRLRSEPEFLDKLVEHVNSNSPFPFGCDSCNVVTAFYHHCLEHVADQSLKTNSCRSPPKPEQESRMQARSSPESLIFTARKSPSESTSQAWSPRTFSFTSRATASSQAEVFNKRPGAET